MQIYLNLYYWPNANLGLGHTALLLSSQHDIVLGESLTFYISAGDPSENIDESTREYGTEVITFYFEINRDNFHNTIKQLQKQPFFQQRYAMLNNNCAHTVIHTLRFLGLNFKHEFLLRPIHVAKQAVKHVISSYKLASLATTAHSELIEKKITYLTEKIKIYYYHIIENNLSRFISFTFAPSFQSLCYLIEDLEKAKIMEQPANYQHIYDASQIRLPMLDAPFISIVSQLITIVEPLVRYRYSYAIN